jgi:hypothetical protein
MSEIIQGCATVSSSGANTIAPLVENKVIKVMSMVVSAAGAVNVYLQTHTSAEAITGTIYLPTNGTVTIPFHPDGWCVTNQGEALDIVLSTGVSVGVTFTYHIV